MKSSIIVKTAFNGEHRWKNAPDEVAFLREFHPHTFTIEAEIAVDGLDRSLEFFMVKREIDKIIERVLPKQFEASCEQIATMLLIELKALYGEEREYIITVSEDGVNSGRIYKKEEQK